MTEPRQETFRATLRTRTPEGEWATLIVTRQGLGTAGRTWLTFHGAIKTTSVLTSEEVAQLIEQLSEASVVRGDERCTAERGDSGPVLGEMAVVPR